MGIGTNIVAYYTALTVGKHSVGDMFIIERYSGFAAPTLRKVLKPARV